MKGYTLEKADGYRGKAVEETPMIGEVGKRLVKAVVGIIRKPFELAVGFDKRADQEVDIMLRRIQKAVNDGKGKQERR